MSEETSKPVQSSTEKTEQVPVILGEDGQPLSKKAMKKYLKEQEKLKKKAERAAQLEKEKLERERANKLSDTASSHYGKLPLIQSSTRTNEKRIKFHELNSETDVGTEVCFRARVHNTRQQGATLTFLTFRQQSELIQGLVKVN